MANGLVPDDTFYLNSVRVNEYLLKDHNVNDIPLPNEDLTELIGITIHNTDDLPEVEDSAEQYTAATMIPTTREYTNTSALSSPATRSTRTRKSTALPSAR